VKFNPTWQQVALLAVLFAAIIVSNMYSPGAFGAVTSIVSVIVSFVVGSKLPASTDSTPALSIVKGDDETEKGQ